MSVNDFAGQVGIVLAPLARISFHHEVLALNVPKATQLLEKHAVSRMPFAPISPILVAGLTIAMRFIFAGCCARAASGHVAAVPPKSVMKSRRRMYPPEGRPLRRLKPNMLRRGGGEKGSQSTLDAATQCPFGVWAVQRRRFPVGASPTRQPLQPEAIGAVMEVTKWLKPWISASRIGDGASVHPVGRLSRSTRMLASAALRAGISAPGLTP